MARKVKSSSRKAKATSSVGSKNSIKNENTLDLYERSDAILTEGLDGAPLSDRTKEAMRQLMGE